jgi:hypothetical protein
MRECNVAKCSYATVSPASSSSCKGCSTVAVCTTTLTLSDPNSPCLCCVRYQLLCLCAGGGDQQAVMQELIKSAQRPVSAGKVRRKKAKEDRPPPRDKSKGFAKAR